MLLTKKMSITAKHFTSKEIFNNVYMTIITSGSYIGLLIAIQFVQYWLDNSCYSMNFLLGSDVMVEPYACFLECCLLCVFDIVLISVLCHLKYGFDNLFLDYLHFSKIRTCLFILVLCFLISVFFELNSVIVHYIF